MLLEELKEEVKKVAVVVSPDSDQIAEIAALGFDVIQIHGQASDELIESAHLPVWKAFNVKDMDMYPHYQSLSNVAGYVLAGGLTPDNVRRAIEQVHPDVVDVSSGIEYDVVAGVQKPGKDPEKMRLMKRNIAAWQISGKSDN